MKQSAIKYTAATGSSPVITGTSVAGYWSATPSGYLPEDGSAVSRTTYSALYAAIGTTYGAGDGSTTFNLPDSRGRIAVNFSQNDSEFNSMGEKSGEKTHTLTLAEMPPHQISIRTEFGTSSNLNVGVPGQYNQPTTNTGYPIRNDYTRVDGGGGGTHNVMQPTIVASFVIKY